MNRMEQNFIEKLKLEFENIKDENGNYEYAKFRHITDKLYMECLALEDIEYKTKYQKLGAGENPYTMKSNLNEPSVGDYITPDEMAQLEAAIERSSIGTDSGIRLNPVSGALEEFNPEKPELEGTPINVAEMKAPNNILQMSQSNKLKEKQEYLISDLEEVNTEKPQLQGESIDVVQARQKAMNMLKPMLEDDNVKATMEELEYLEILNCAKKDYNGWYIKHDNDGTQLVRIEVTGIFKKDKNAHHSGVHIVIYLNINTDPYSGKSDTMILNWAGRNEYLIDKKYGKRIATL